MVVVAMMQQQPVSAQPTTDEARDSLLSLVKTNYPDYCSMEHIQRISDYENEYLSDEMTNSNEMAQVAANFDAYVKLLHDVCIQLLDEKIDADTQNGRVFASAFKQLFQFKEMLHKYIADSSDEEKFMQFVDDYLYKMVEERGEVDENDDDDQSTTEKQMVEMFAELRDDAGKLKSIIDFDLMPALTLASRVKYPMTDAQQAEAQTILDMRSLCSRLTHIRGPLEEYVSDVNSKSAVPTVTDSAQVNARFGARFEALASRLVH